MNLDRMMVVRRRHINLMRKTVRIIHNVLRPITQEQAQTWRDQSDGEKGWSLLEVVGHIAAFDRYFHHRARLMLTEEHPQLPAYDHEALAVADNYNGRDLDQTLAQLADSREQFAQFFEGLDAAEWTRTGIHPERDYFDMTDAVMQVGLHDADHLEQMTRIIADYKEVG